MRYAYLKETGRYLGVYSDDFELSADLDFINLEPIDLFKPIINADKSGWIEGLNDLEVIQAKELSDKNYIKEKYQIHRDNGWNEYQDFRASVVYDIKKGVITEDQAFLLEDYLKNVYDKINNTGDWKTALYTLNQLFGHDAWMQDYIDTARSRISDYILKNYDPDPVT